MKPKEFIFEGYDFDSDRSMVRLRYGYDNGLTFEETARFDGIHEDYDKRALDAAIKYLFICAGTSYYKAYFTPKFDLGGMSLSEEDAEFFNELYAGGLSQYMYENGLNLADMARFKSVGLHAAKPMKNNGLPKDDILLMQSGGKDSLLAAEVLNSSGKDFTAWHLTPNGAYPEVIERSSSGKLRLVERQIDIENLNKAAELGGMNGHVPFSAILAGYALVSAVLGGHGTVLAANESSSDEANVETEKMTVNHQYSKTFEFEKAFNRYLRRNLPGMVRYGSILRRYNELEVAEKFVDKCWAKYGHQFSSCNASNYKQDNDSTKLKWDGKCSKCANAFILFAPFVEYDELVGLFGGKNLAQDPKLKETFKQLMGLSDIKPFECVGTFDELKAAYASAVARDERYRIEGIKPEATATGHTRYEQGWIGDLLGEEA